MISRSRCRIVRLNADRGHGGFGNAEDAEIAEKKVARPGFLCVLCVLFDCAVGEVQVNVPLSKQ
jgi:hypothetical protein